MPPYTKRAIIQSFISLAEQKPLSKITVKNIVDDCEINRNTFYYYFKDIYDVAETLLSEEANRVHETVNTEDDWAFTFGHSVEFIVSHRKLMRNIYDSIGMDGMNRYLSETVECAVSVAVKKATEDISVNEEDKALLSLFYRQALLGILTDWIANNRSQDPRYMVKRLSLLMKGSLRKSRENSATIHENQTKE